MKKDSDFGLNLDRINDKLNLHNKLWYDTRM